ncbi:hypothetical protein MMC08_004551 [Hypocenomyce scalaris]|nr:hypothetical protein [Hypocenomyce scalaris]
MGFHFLRLPAEIRNKIYRLALVQPQPIELWPTNEVAFAEDFDIIPEEDATPEHSAELVKAAFNHVRSNSVVAILRVSKMIYKEATPIFYGENEFRFSMDLGWMAMFHFLFTIGERNRRMVSRLAVFAPIMGVVFWDRFISPYPTRNVLEYTRFNIPEEHLTLDYSNMVSRCCAFLVEAKSLQQLFLVLPPGLMLGDNALEKGLYNGFKNFVDRDVLVAGFEVGIILVFAQETYRENRKAASYAEANLLWGTRVKSANEWRYEQAVITYENEGFMHLSH